MKMRYLLILLPFFSTGPAAAQADESSLEQLINEVRDAGAQERRYISERTSAFLEARDRQQALLEEAREKRREVEATADRLRAEFETGEERLADLETNLSQRSADIDAMLAVVRQVAGDAQPMVQNSITSAELTGRAEPLERLAETSHIPSMADIRALWLMLLDEIEAGGRVSRFEAALISREGEETRAEVTRVGPFVAFHNGEYLRFLSDSEQLMALPRQPAEVSRTAVREFEAATNAVAPIAIDPSRGAILGLIIQTPDLTDRLQQGGVIGYIILGLGAIGFIIGLWRLIAVALAERSLHRQADNGATDPAAGWIGAIRGLAADRELASDREGFATRLDELVSEASRDLRRGLNSLSIFAAVSPLLGLLGTVTGMIATFQVITLFGAGDPRLMSGGISQALVTTQLGLAVAIPLLIIHSFVQGRASAAIALLDRESAQVFSDCHPGGNS